MRPPRFEPGSPAWEASVLTKLDYGRACELIQRANKKSLPPAYSKKPFKPRTSNHTLQKTEIRLRATISHLAWKRKDEKRRDDKP